MTKRRRCFRNSSPKKTEKKALLNGDHPQDDEGIKDDKLTQKMEMFTYVSKSFISKKKTLNSRQWQCLHNYVEIEEETLKTILQEKFNCILAWNTHYDYALWKMVEEHFDFLWLELEHEMYLGVEYGLYEEVKNLFLELRNFLQWTGRIKERIFFAAWLRREAKRREDLGMMYFAMSSLVWSYTSSGCYQDLEKAYELWNKLTFYILPTEPSTVCTERKNIQDSLTPFLYTELLMEVHENGVRLAIRQGEFEKAFIRIKKGNNEIEKLFYKNLISLRLRERLRLAFKYHKGMIFYLMKDHEEARQVFEAISENAKVIGWNRAVEGAKSWLKILAMENKEHSKCDSLFEDIQYSRD